MRLTDDKDNRSVISQKINTVIAGAGPATARRPGELLEQAGKRWQGAVRSPNLGRSPLSLTVRTPSSRTPALSHFWIRRSMRRSLIRCSRKRTSHCWLTESKEAVTHYPSPRHIEFCDDPA